MNTTKRRIIIVVLILLVLVVSIFFILSEKYKEAREYAFMLTKEYTSKLSEVIDLENIDDLRLTIYYMHPNVFSDQPASVKDLIEWCELEDYDLANKTVVNGKELKKHTDLLKELSNTEVIPVANKNYLNARMHYIFENKKNLKKFDVTMWSASRNVGDIIINNDVEVEVKDIFLSVIIPFLPEDDEIAQAARNQLEQVLEILQTR